MTQILKTGYDALNSTRAADFVAPLLLRLYLAPVLMQAGWNKMNSWESTVAWFGNTEWGLGLPVPALMAALAVGAEFFGAILLLVGLATRLVAIPLMITMVVAAVTVHLENGWLAIADASSWFADGTIMSNPAIMEAPEKLDAAKSLLQEHGHYEWLTSSGNFVILNNGIEFAATYFIMLLTLFFIGAGKYVSVDYWLSKKL